MSWFTAFIEICVLLSSDFINILIDGRLRITHYSVATMQKSVILLYNNNYQVDLNNAVDK